MPSKKNKARASIKTAGAAAVASEGDSDAAAMKGPSSGRSPKHTVQLIIVLALQTSMLAFSMLYLPQGLGTQEGPKISFLSGIVDMLHADNVVMKMILALQGVLVSQAWFCGRFRWWWEYAQKMENNEIAEGTRAPTFMEQLELLTYSALYVPIPFGVCYAALLLLGAPTTSHFLGTAVLSAYLTLLAFLPALHVLGRDYWGWSRIYAAMRPSNAREKVLLIQTGFTLFGAWAGSAALALDWGRPWQAYPVPSILGALAGHTAGNVCAAFAYLFDSGPKSAVTEEKEEVEKDRKKGKRK